ncbi:hypothetical protein MHBO_004107 [Bonamia ostreae]|uniref:Uncharacterized protein n=1 Tax=Bonamia ostreae TaxID=126728 RepID=A0ABV2ASF4_9EUKA
MMKKCKEQHKDQLWACKKQAATFSMIADIAGCNAFMDSQDDACNCVFSGKRPFRRHNDL